MFLGHFGLAFAARKASPSISLGALFLACQFADLLWPTLVLAGIERVEIEPGATTFMPLDFVSYPYSHSLVALILWAVIVGTIYMMATRAPAAAAVTLGLLVLSHWALDYITHRPDMPLTMGGPQRVGPERMVDVGEVVTAGAPLLELVDLDRLYLQVYVPEVQIGRVRLELPARIYTDAFPDQPFQATVRYIASKAEFTPKEVQTPDERVKLIYAVRLYLTDNSDHRLTPGLPADAIIRWKDGVAWAKPR